MSYVLLNLNSFADAKQYFLNSQYSFRHDHSQLNASHFSKIILEPESTITEGELQHYSETQEKETNKVKVKKTTTLVDKSEPNGYNLR